MHAAVILFSFLLSCGPEDCDDLEFQVDQVLDQEEITWQNHLAAYKVCERACSDTEDSCMDMANGIGIDPLDTGLVLPTPAECEADYDVCEEECFHPTEDTYPYTKARHSPVISWSGGPVVGVSIVISRGPKKDDVVWSVKCPDEDNCISPPVVYGVVPEGAELNTEACANEKCDTDQRTLLVDGQFYKASGGRDIGEKFPCVPEDDHEYEFEHPNRKVYSYD